MKPVIAPSILSADFSNLGGDVRAAITAGINIIHIDVMDGQFVPNITIGPLVVESLKPLAKELHFILDVHLMIETPDRMIPEFLKAGADVITVHVETCPHLHRTLQMIRENGAKPAVTLNPATSLVTLEEILGEVDQVLIMSVNPGFGGQKYIENSTLKIARLKKMLFDRGLSHVDIQVDGGVNLATIGPIVKAGATILVAGSAVFNSKAPISDNIKQLQKAIDDALL